MYEELGGIISRSLIQKVLDERRKAEGRVNRPRSRSYEFASPGVTYSTDFIAVCPRGRVLKTQDDRARCSVNFSWNWLSRVSSRRSSRDIRRS